MQWLQSRKDKFITDANKSRTIVIVDEEDHIEEAEIKLSNKQNYRKKIRTLLQSTMKLSRKLNPDFKKKIY